VSGGWYFYALSSSDYFADYPKVGIWPDGLYITANMFSYTGGALGLVRAWALNKTQMEAGQTASVQSVNLPASTGGATVFTALPSTYHTVSGAPPAGRENFITSIWSSKVAHVWKWHVDWTTPANSSFSGPANVTLSTWNVSPATIVEPSPGNALDTLQERLMVQAQYTNIGGVESLWLTHTVANAGATSLAAPRWYQINVTGGTVVTSAPLQQSTWAPDTSYSRWMGSLAVDNAGNMALGYSRASSAAYPAIYYAGRLAGDPASTLSQSETLLYQGLGYQCCTFSDGVTKNSRWGDYSAMTIDPDGCTFWYTTEYYDSKATTNAGNNWQTRIGSFRFPTANCPSNPTAPTYHTIIFDGGVGSDWNIGAERLGTMPTSGAKFDYYLTWDANNLYVGIKGDTPGNPYTYVAVVDTDPGIRNASNSGATAALACAGGFNASGKGNFALVRTGGTLTATGTTTKQTGATGSWTAWTPSTNTEAKDGGRAMAEFQFAWSGLTGYTSGNPIGLYLYVCSGSTLISAWPPENLQSGNPILLAEAVTASNDSGQTPRTYAQRLDNNTISISNGPGPFDALNGYAEFANVNGLSGTCSFDVSVQGNADTTDPQRVRRVYTLTPDPTTCAGLQADVALMYEDGTMPNNAPSELNGLTEASLQTLRYDGSAWRQYGSAVDATNNKVSLPGVSNFSPWSLGCGVPIAVSAANLTDLGGNQLQVTWTAVAGTTQYEVWWSTDTPYFAPGAVCTPGINCATVPGTSTSFTHTAPAGNRTYIVRAVSGCGKPSTSYPRTGRFSFTLVPGN
jgi:hypothetical protein